MEIKDYKCSECKHWGGQGTCGTITETYGDNRTCMAFIFSDMDNVEFKPMPEFVVTYGNMNNAKGHYKVHKDFGCVNQNKIFD